MSVFIIQNICIKSGSRYKTCIKVIDKFSRINKRKQPTEKVFDLPKNEKMARLTMSNEIRRITKALELPQTGKNHEFRKYHCQLAVEHYVSKGWEREKAERFVIQRHLSHSSERQDLKKIYLYS